MIECSARICAILRDNGMWQVSKVVEQHNHELYPSISSLLLSMDFKQNQYNIFVRAITFFNWEKQFRDAYTNKLFENFQAQIKKMLYCNQLIGDDNEEIGFEEENLVKKSLRSSGYWRLLSRITCFGLLCAHILKVASIKRVNRFPNRYVLRRWRKDVHHRYSRIFFDEGYPHITCDFEKIKDVKKAFNETVDSAIATLARLV
ncbi:hypothetical protein M9H77_31376 [Catharanthus roseus]|uniref:Uncharacterized protein n=1 Tax=Catharanthus roseus TaxID=4058 RepID=A0ACC0A091_CATRO|nr:hypothetical protein M9H77_31376 [Catharanthus roseus]